MEASILCLNGGSSSLKFSVYRMAEGAEERTLSGAVEAIGTPAGRAWLRTGDKVILDKSGVYADHARAAQGMFAALRELGVEKPAAAGHRVVHGGPILIEPQRIDKKLIEELKGLVHFAPLHLPSQIALIEAIGAHYPDLPQTACFDTAFHARMPEAARRFALPRGLWEQGIRRYGFHGLSYEFIVDKLGTELGKRAIIAHLGNGASMAAVKDGAPADTSMGLTPTGGFMMGTRSGDLDPGVLLHLMNQGHSAARLEALLNHESGLLGVSGQTNEMKSLLEKRRTDPAAAMAVEMFCYQARKFVGAYAGSLGGLDTLVFTGGIGERSAEVRSEICSGLEFLGIAIDEASNRANAAVISAGSRCVVRVVATDEDLMIARHTRRTVVAG